MSQPPIVVDGPAPPILPAYPLPGQDRSDRPLYVLERTIHFKTLHGWHRVPEGYVTDFASIPAIGSYLSGMRLQPLGRWAWAAVAHDWGYAIGQPGYRSWIDDMLLERMELDGVGSIARSIIFHAVRWGGQGGYDDAPSWWDTENFADPITGAYPRNPPFARQGAYVGATWGLRAQPDWPETA